jgi:hypothetical protein
LILRPKIKNSRFRAKRVRARNACGFWLAELGGQRLVEVAAAGFRAGRSLCDRRRLLLSVRRCSDGYGRHLDDSRSAKAVEFSGDWTAWTAWTAFSLIEKKEKGIFAR